MKSLPFPSTRGRRSSGSLGRSWARWLLSAAIVAMTSPVLADTFTVDIGTDEKQDLAITDHCAALGNTTHCSLRAAIEIGNARPGSHTIGFSVPLVTVVDGDLRDDRGGVGRAGARGMAGDARAETRARRAEARCLRGRGGPDALTGRRRRPANV